MIYTVTLLGLFVILLSSIPKSIFKYGLELSWITIFIFLAIRYDFGNDYLDYKYAFDEINQFHYFSIDDEYHYEPGWQLLCRLFKPFGFYWMIAVITAFECFVLYRFIKDNVPERYYWLSNFIYIFSPSLLLIGSSMMRQMLSIVIFVWAIRYIQQRRIIPYILCIFIASQFHSSAVILYPVYLLTYITNNRLNKNQFIYILFFYTILHIVSDRLGGTLGHVASFIGEEDAYELYIENAVFAESNTGLGFILQFIIFICIIYNINQISQRGKILFYILILGSFVKPFAETLPIIMRITYYFGIMSLVCYPILWGGEKCATSVGLPLSAVIKQDITKSVAILLMIVMTLYGFYGHFQSPIWEAKYTTYKTIFNR